MTATRTTFDAALKEDYQPLIRKQLATAWGFLSQLDKNTKDVEGRRAVLSLHVSRNSGVGARHYGDGLPTAGAQGYVEERVPMRRNYGRVAIDGELIVASKSDKGSFARALEQEMKGVVDDLKRDVNRQCFGDANKAIAQCGATTTSNTVVLAAATTVTQMRQFEVDMRVDIGTTADYQVVAANRAITAINRAGRTITIDGAAVTTTASHFVTRAGTRGAELTGIRQIVDSAGALFNVDPATTPVWVSHVENTYGDPTEVKMDNSVTQVELEGGVAPNLLVSDFGSRRRYASNLLALKRFTNTTTLRGGFSALQVNAGNHELPWFVDRDAPEGTVFILNTGNIIQHELSDWSFMDRDGTVLKYVTGFDRYEAVLYKYHEITTDKRNAHGRLNGVTVA